MAGPVGAPTLRQGVDELVDWLELTAIFSEFGVARVDAMLGSLLEQEEEAEDNIGERDRAREEVVESVENEIRRRQEALQEVYPFNLNDTGEELLISEDWRELKFSFYIVCLITAHVTKSAILQAPPEGNLLTRLRNDIFQIIATLGVAGQASGPAFSVGWPRRSGEALVELMERAAAEGGGFAARNPPSPYVPPEEKDGGIDVIGWTPEVNPPPSAFYFAQTASGLNWRGKPVQVHCPTFQNAYMQDHMTGNIQYFTIIPFRITNETLWYNEHKTHSSLLDRLRLPRKAWLGLQVANSGMTVDGSDRTEEIMGWIGDYLDYTRAA